MKRLRLKTTFLACFAAFLFLVPLHAQSSLAYSDYGIGFSTPKKKKKKGDSKFKDHLWYGGGLSLGFSAGQDFFGNNYSVFGFGISPMVGYKIVGPLSVGPRVSILYTSQKYTGIKTFNLFDLELAMFARVRIFKGLFFQGELGMVSDQYPYVDNTGYQKGTRTRPAQNLGLGYNFSNGEGGMGQEIAIMYDIYIGNDINSYEQPWQYRIAFTYGF